MRSEFVTIVMILASVAVSTVIPVGSTSRGGADVQFSAMFNESASSTLSSSSTTFEKAIAISQSYASDVFQTSDGGYAVGSTVYCGNSCSFPLVSKFDSSGNIAWQAIFQVPNVSTQLSALHQTSDGGYVWSGYNAYGYGCLCALVVKLDSTGRIQWSETFTGNSQANDVQQTSDGGYVVAGGGAWIAKLDALGNVQWQTVLSSYYGAYIGSIEQTSDGGYVVAGSGITYSGEVFVVKLDANGSVKWQEEYGAGSGFGIQQTADGGYIVVGGAGTGGYLSGLQPLAIKLDSSGKTQWAKTFQLSNEFGSIDSVRQTSDGGYVLAGYFFSYYDNAVYKAGYHSWIIKTDSSGNIQWQKTYGSLSTCSYCTFDSIDRTSDGGFIAAGTTNQFNGIFAYIVKTDSAGNVNSCNDVQSTAGSAKNSSNPGSSAGFTVSTTATTGTTTGSVTASSKKFSLKTEC